MLKSILIKEEFLMVPNTEHDCGEITMRMCFVCFGLGGFGAYGAGPGNIYRGCPACNNIRKNKPAITSRKDGEKAPGESGAISFHIDFTPYFK